MERSPLATDHEGDRAGHVYTLGHGRQHFDVFSSLLTLHGVRTVVDVRSRPRSRSPQFNERAPRAALESAGIAYTWLPALGGLPEESTLLLPSGEPDVAAVRVGEDYRRALDDVVELAFTAGAALLCSEAEPAACHRSAWLAAHLTQRGVDVEHILKDGSLAGSLACSR